MWLVKGDSSSQIVFLLKLFFFQFMKQLRNWCLPSLHLLLKPVGHTKKAKAAIIKIKTKESLLGLFFQGSQARCENLHLPLGWQVKGFGKAKLPPLPSGCIFRLFPHPLPPRPTPLLPLFGEASCDHGPRRQERRRCYLQPHDSTTMSSYCL